MLPSIGLVESVEMIRDGGSLAAALRGGDGCAYWLLLKVLWHPSSSGSPELCGYADPVILDRLIGTSIQISWSHARILLNQIRREVHEERDLRWLESMDEVVTLKGGLPPRIVEHFKIQ